MVLELFGFYFDKLEILSIENLVIIGIAVFWMLMASIQDIKRREVENWWNFSLIVFILAFRAFLSVELGNYWYFAWGLIGLLFGFVLANAFYYGRLFAGGDAKLMMALGTIIPLSLDWMTNVQLTVFFIFSLLMIGSVYGLIYSLSLMIINFKNFRMEFSLQLKNYKKLFIYIEIASLLLIILFSLSGFYLGAMLSLILFLCPVLLIYARAIEESCMMKSIDVSEVTIGDWLAAPIKIGKRKIKPNWEGLTEAQVNLIKNKYKGKIIIKQGLPFVPAFFISFIVMLYIIFKGL